MGVGGVVNSCGVGRIVPPFPCVRGALPCHGARHPVEGRLRQGCAPPAFLKHLGTRGRSCFLCLGLIWAPSWCLRAGPLLHMGMS